MPEPSNHSRIASEERLAAAPIPGPAVRDRVIRAAIFAGLIHASDIGPYWLAYERLPHSGRQRFWRYLADQLGADREQFFSIAARTYGFDEIEMSVSDLIRFVQQVRSRFSKKAWRRMNDLRVLPVGMDGRDGTGSEDGRIIFACSDPTRLEVNSFLSSLPIDSFVLRYASWRSVDYVLDRILPVIFSKSKTLGDRGPARLLPMDPIRDRAATDEDDYRRAA